MLRSILILTTLIILLISGCNKNGQIENPAEPKKFIQQKAETKAGQTSARLNRKAAEIGSDIKSGKSISDLIP